MRSRFIAVFVAMMSIAWSGAAAMQAAPGRQDLAGRKIMLVTGSTDGLGREVARRIAAEGAHVIVHGRNKQRGDSLVAEIQRGGKGSARFYAADLASLAQVRTLAQSILKDYDRLDVLVNNAGIWLNTGPRQVSADGHELHFAVNYLSGVLLTRMLQPLLVKSAPSRVINVASSAQTPIDFTDVMLERSYGGSRGYGQSKLAQVMFTFDLAVELEPSRVSVNALHPATLMDTEMVRAAGMPARSTIDQGATALMNLVTSADVGTGQYFNGLRAVRASAGAYDLEARAKLRELTRRLIGL